MEQQKPRITVFQLLAFHISVMVGAGILTLPREVADIAKQGAWISVLLGGVIMMASVWLATSTARLYAQDTFDQYIKKILGPILGQVVLVYVTFFFIVGASNIARQFANVIKLFILDQTPIEVLIFSILFCAYFIAQNGLQPIVFFMEIMLIPTKLGLVSILLIAISAVDMHELKPVLANVSSIIQAVPITAFAYANPELLMGFIYPFLLKPDQALKWTFSAVAFVMFLYTFVTVLSIGVFSAEELHYLPFPTTMILRTVELAGFLERLDAVGVIFYIPNIFMVFLAMFYFSGVIVSRQVGLEESRSIFVLLIPIIYMISLVKPDEPSFNKLGELITKLGFYYSTAGIFLIWVVAQLRRKIGGNNR